MSKTLEIETRHKQKTALPTEVPTWVASLNAKTCAGSFAVWSLLFFIAFNFMFWLFAGESKNSKLNSVADLEREMWAGKSSLEMIIQEFNSLAGRPQVVLLGSSLMVHPFWALDAALNRRIGDIFHHHRSLALEQVLKSTGVKNPCVYSLSFFGQMCSDAYLNVKELLKGDRKPDWLILGLAPRDYYDFDAREPMSTVTFKRLVSLSNFVSYADAFLPAWTDKADFVVSRAFILYGKRQRLQREVIRGLEFACDFLCGHSEKEKALKHEQVGFFLKGNASQRWANSVAEYRRRYKNIEKKDLSLQFDFLQKILEICDERGINAVVINMPLSPENRSLLPPGFYQSYKRMIRSIAQRSHVRYLDLGDNPQFGKADFWDTAHLNHLGGRKLVEHLKPILCCSKNLPVNLRSKSTASF